jgi:uncharacterized protein (TIGR03382 family)
VNLLWLLLATASAEVPIDASFPDCGEVDRPDLCPADLEEEWWMISYVPTHARSSVRDAELDMGSGVSADRAWRTTTGRFDVILAVADSGIEWHNTHLVNKVHLNIGELPAPICEDDLEATDFDCDGNGLTNLEDYAFDHRVEIDAGRDAADHMLDPSDLIYTAWGDDWDGIDNDGNGYTDDIAGWDFFANDNDPWHEYDRGYGTHGSDVMEDAAAEGTNAGEASDGKIGICPNCSLLPVRIGDTFVVDGTRAGQGIAFAVDSGAVAINLAVGALSNPSATTQAAAYAFDNGATIIGAAGDENAYHHNFPAMLDNVLYVHSIRHDTMDDDAPVYSYFNTWNCNNYGARMTVVAPSPACATGAVAVTTGVVGLIHSAARNAGITLSAGEVYQLVVQTALDVWLSEDERDRSGAYPSQEGWDAFSGYGRVDAGAAASWVDQGKIPPVATIDAPGWFAPISRSAVDTVDIRGTVSARSGSYSYVVEYGLGHEPSTWTELTTASGSTPTSGVLATLDLADIPDVEIGEAERHDGILERLERVNRPAVTVRVRVTDSNGRNGEMRKTFFVVGDPDTLPGFPLNMETSGESSPILADLDGDNIFEIVIATADGTVLALHGDGTPVDGWPVALDPADVLHPDAEAFASGDVTLDIGDGIIATVAVGDLDGDGQPEVVAASGQGQLHAWHSDGRRVAGFPYWSIGREPDEFDGLHTYDQGFAGAPTLVDLDGDGTLEIVVVGLDSRLYVVDHTGADWGPYPVEVCYPGTDFWDFEDQMCGIEGHRSITSTLVADVDGDGDFEIGLGTNEAIYESMFCGSYMFDATSGTHEPNWPRTDRGLIAEAALLPLVGQGHPASMAAADLDGDGDLELANPIMLGQTNIVDYEGEDFLAISAVATAWSEDSNADVPAVVQMVNNPAFGDLDGDGVPDLVMGGAGALWIGSLAMTKQFEFQHAVVAWSGATGEVLPGWPRQIEDIQFLVAPAIADVSGDGMPEVIYGSAGYLLYAWDGTGALAEGWPKFTGHWILGSPAVGDITGDGYIDVVVSTREGYLFAWRTNGRADQQVQWQSLHHDPQNTGNYETPLVTQAGPPPESPTKPKEKGCGCGSTGGAAPWGFLALLGLIRRRRSSAA